MAQAKFRKTVIGYFNVTIEGRVYNIDPQNFTRITGVRKDITLACGELNAAQVEQVRVSGRLIKSLSQVETAIA